MRSPELFSLATASPVLRKESACQSRVLGTLARRLRNAPPLGIVFRRAAGGREGVKRVRRFFSRQRTSIITSSM